MRIRRELIVGLALAAVTLAVYWPVRTHGFVNYDDPDYVTTNWHVQAGLTWPGVAWAFTTYTANNWHPLAWLSHMLDCQWYGLRPAGHHLTSLLLHIANTLLLFLVLRRMTGALWRSAGVAALFAWHPLHVESVAWVAERKDVLSAFFFLLTLWAYARYAERKSLKSKTETEVQGSRFKVQGSGRPVPRTIFNLPSSSFYLLSLFFFACGLMSKPMVVTLPFVLLLLDYWPLRRFSFPSLHRSTTPLLPLLLEKMPFLALSAAGCVATLWAQSQVVVPASVLPLGVRLGHALTACLHYLTTTIIPRHLAFFYPYPVATPVVETVVAGILLASISLLALRFAARAPYLVVGWLWFLGMLVPVIGLVQVGIQAWADRYTYLPLIGLFIMIGWGLVDWVADLNHRWTRMDTDAARHPARGDGGTAARKQIPKAETQPTQPSITPALHHSITPSHLCTSVSICGYGLAALALGVCVWLTSRQLSYWQDDMTLFKHALQVTRNNAAAHNYLGLALASQGNTEAAMRHLETALKIEPWRASAQGGLAGILGQQGDFAGAIEHYRRALQIDPNLAEALNNLAWLLATCPDASLRDGPEAVRLAEQACRLTEYHRTTMVGTLAAAYAEAGRFAEAVATAQTACALAAEASERALLARNRELLELYRANQPYHEPATR